MNQQMKIRFMRMVILGAVAVFIGALMAWVQVQKGAMIADKGSRPAPVAGISIGGKFTLVNQDGETVTQQAFAGRYKLIYFGFTYCPAICPTELQKITKVLNALGEGAENIQPIFISVDPERDTPPVMKDYISLFHPRLVGLTGSVEQIEQVKKDYRIYSAKVWDEQNSDYTVDHSSFIYLMSPEDELISIYRINDTADYMEADIRAKL